MPRKSKYSFKQKKWAVEQYLNGYVSAVEIATQLDMPIKSGYIQISSWAHQYQSNHEAFLSNAKHNAHYSKEFKEKVVQEYLNGNTSLSSLANKYGIRSHETVRRWVSKYNSHIDNRNYEPYPEVYMTKARRKTTQPERMCLPGNQKYRQTAIRKRWKIETYQLIHDCHQKYNWKIDLMCRWAKIARS
ncbi:transposase, partial [Lactobacillus xujianguonis]|uniref:transposase n=1 Tax=Lactobacillus xujianguonis TaxID=2495899 RepID=UPI001FE3A08B